MCIDTDCESIFLPFPVSGIVFVLTAVRIVQAE